MKSRVSKFEGFAMIGFSVFVDTTQALGEALIFVLFTLATAGLGTPVGILFSIVWGFFWSIIATVVLSFWFSMKGVDRSGSKKVARMAATALGEQVPFLNALPLWTVSTWYALWQLRKAEKEEAERTFITLQQNEG